ncbi:MAG: glycosyltransferase family 9 protein [Streptosporangiales bacterium]|nr:glycosyltransferase family 9 protein [Streptosporangiales bacterium]
MAELVPGVRTIVVLRAGRVGDFLMTLPALAALRAAYPRARLVLVAEEWHAAFLDGRPGPVDEVAVLPPVPGVTLPPDAEPGPAERAARERFTARVRDLRPGLAVQLHGGGRNSGPLLRELGAGVSVGPRTTGAPALDRWIRYEPLQHDVLRALEIVALAGARAQDLRPRVTLTNADERELTAVLDGGVPRDMVVLHPGAADARRRWPAERFAQVGDALAERGLSVVVTGTEAERPVVERVTAAMRRPAVPLAGRLGLGGLTALLGRARLYVGNDTGPRHLAEAVGCPTAAVYWCGNLMTAGPLGRATDRPLVSWTTHCPDCGADAARGKRRCPHDGSFVTDVPVAEVTAAAYDLLDSPVTPR